MTDTTSATVPEQADRMGLACRWCGGRDFRVVYTRPTCGGRIMRRRACRHCGKRMTTWERANFRELTSLCNHWRHSVLHGNSGVSTLFT